MYIFSSLILLVINIFDFVEMCDEEDTLFHRFSRCFWNEYIGGLRSSDFSVKVDTNVTTNAIELVKSFKALDDIVSSLGLYVSRNEGLEDINTNQLLLLMIPYVVGDITYSFTPFDLEKRESILKSVSRVWEAFLGTMEQINIASVPTAGDERTRKIAAQRMMEELKPSLQKLFLVWSSSGDKMDMDEYREDVVAMLEFFSLKASCDLRFVKDELYLLRTKPVDETCGTGSSSSSQITGKKLWSMKLDKTLIRTTMQSNVFKPDISMPTISLDEFARVEYSRMLESNRGSGAKVLSEPDDDFYARNRRIDDEDEVKQRQWDDWKDENPRGMGNKLVNRG